MNIEFCIPSLNRPDKLARLLDSIPGDCIVSPKIETEPRALPVIVNECFAESTGDVVCILGGHLVLRDGCVDEIRAAFGEHFSDLDGVVGLNIENLPPKPDCHEYAFMCVGRKFIERFDNARLFCEEYYHFGADTELGRFAVSIDRFHFAESARVFTYHPITRNARADTTHRASRKRLSHDKRIMEQRQRHGLLWGTT